MGELRYPPRAVEHYAVALVHSLDDAVVRHRRFKVVLDAGGGTASLVLPHLLSRLSLDTLIVNGHLDENRVAPTDGERQADLDRLAKLVTASGADLGVLFDAVGERITLVDERGAIVGLDRALLLFVDLIARTEGDGGIALPVSTTRLAADLAARGGRQVHGCKLSTSAIMRAAQRDGVVFAGAEGGGYVFPSPASRLRRAAVVRQAAGAAGRPRHHPGGGRRRPARAVGGPAPGPDALGAQGGGDAPAGRGDQGPAGRRHRRGQGLPRPDRPGTTPAVPTRSTGDHPGGSGHLGDDWALVIPDTVEPVTHLWAEAADEPSASALADEYEALIRRAAELD